MYEKDFIIEYVDVGSDNKLSNYGFFKYLQEMGCIHADICGYGLKDTPITRLAWILLNWKLNIFYRPSWNSKLHIKTWPSYIDSLSCFRDFEITDERGNKVAIATSKWVLVNIDTGHISKITPDIMKEFSPTRSSLCEEIEKLKEPLTFEKTFKYTILKRDIDTNKHVNNLSYITLASEVLPDNVNFTKIDVMYKKQCFLNDTIVFKLHQEDDECTVCVKSLDDSVLHAIVRFKA